MTDWLEIERPAGVSLEDVLHHVRTDGPPPIDVVVSLVAELADALVCAHEQGIVHGSIRPRHLRIDAEGHLALLGFGSAALGEDPGRQCYAAPESLGGAPAEARADLYSLGVVAYELVTGRPLFDDHLDLELRRYMAARISLPSTYNSACPRALDELLVGALATDPNERWATAAELRAAIERLGGPAPALVRAWLDRVAGSAPPPAIAAPSPVPAAPPGRPRRLARGTGRLPSPSEIMALEDHEAETVILDSTPPHRRALRLPLEPPAGAAQSEAAAFDTPPLPVFAPSSWDSTEPRLCPMPESHALPRFVDLVFAFAAGAATTYLLLTWLG